MNAAAGGDEMVTLDQELHRYVPRDTGGDMRLIRGRYVVCGVQSTSIRESGAKDDRKERRDGLIGGFLFLGCGITLYVLYGLVVVPAIFGFIGICGVLGGLGVGGNKKRKYDQLKTVIETRPVAQLRVERVIARSDRCSGSPTE